MREPSTWLFLRGFTREAGHWGAFLDQFRKVLAPDEVVTIDLPGAGEFRDVSCPASVSGIFEFVRSRAIERIKSQNQFKLLTVSLGGMVAMEWMRQKPEDLKAVTLINTSSRALSPFYYRLRWQVWREVMRVITLPTVREREKAIIELIMNSEQARELAFPAWVKIGQERPISYRNAFAQLLAASRFRGLDTKPQTPVLLLNSLGDRLVDPSCSSAIQKRWDWPIAKHPWAGHDLPWDDPNWVIEKVSSWNQTLR